jgi:uncharacterized membrane protein YraQ (UPF0718 family)
MHKRLVIISIICIAIAGYFWTQSRYPALNEKAMMSSRLETNRLSFNTKFDIDENASFTNRILLGTANWAYTNKQGMTFGVVFGGAFLTLLQILPPSKRKNGFVNSLKGLFTGAPLGVCANCVAPIGQSMYESGSRIETVLATMISSPTMNVIVLTMVFSLFPFSFALIKVIATLILILVVIPWVTKILFSKENDIKRVKEVEVSVDEVNKVNSESWITASITIIKFFAKNLWYLIYKTVPLMLVAGFLGIVLLEFIPLESFVFLKESPLSLILVALVSTVIPAPITFDVIVASALNTAGLSSSLTMVFLIASGTYSIYPMFILWKSISKKVAISVFIAVMFTAITAGISVNAYNNYNKEATLQIFDDYFESTGAEDYSPTQSLEMIIRDSISKTIPYYQNYDGFMPMDSIYFLGLAMELDTSIQVVDLDQFIDKSQTEISFYRYFDANSVVNLETYKSSIGKSLEVYSLFDKALIKTLYCDVYGYSEQDFIELLSFRDPSYGDTHVLSALQILKENGCYDILKLDKLKETIANEMARNNDGSSSDLNSEKIVVLYWTGYGNLVEEDWVYSITQSQSEDGGWGDYVKSESHRTGLSLLALVYFLEQNEKQEFYPITTQTIIQSHYK